MLEVMNASDVKITMFVQIYSICNMELTRSYTLGRVFVEGKDEWKVYQVVKPNRIVNDLVVCNLLTTKNRVHILLVYSY